MVLSERSQTFRHDQYSCRSSRSSLLQDCVVTKEDFDCAMQDVRDSLGDADYTETEDDVKENEDTLFISIIRSHSLLGKALLHAAGANSSSWPCKIIASDRKKA
jgi:hypothetical protein